MRFLAERIGQTVSRRKAIPNAGAQFTHFDWGGGVSSLICPNTVYFQKLPEFNLTEIKVMYGVPSLPQPQYVN